LDTVEEHDSHVKSDEYVDHCREDIS